jgi:hypothetical protein
VTKRRRWQVSGRSVLTTIHGRDEPAALQPGDGAVQHLALIVESGVPQDDQSRRRLIMPRLTLNRRTANRQRRIAGPSSRAWTVAVHLYFAK